MIGEVQGTDEMQKFIISTYHYLPYYCMFKYALFC